MDKWLEGWMDGWSIVFFFPPVVLILILRLLYTAWRRGHTPNDTRVDDFTKQDQMPHLKCRYHGHVLFILVKLRKLRRYENTLHSAIPTLKICYGHSYCRFGFIRLARPHHHGNGLVGRAPEGWHYQKAS